jgi:outer membrane protein insertion porin family
LRKYVKIVKYCQAFMLLIAGIFFVGCNVTKSVPGNEMLYTGARLKVENKGFPKEIEKSLSEAVRPKPNTNLFGIRYKLMLYNAIPETVKPKSFLGKLKNKFGEPPVLVSQVNQKNNAKRIHDELFKVGYLRSTSKSEVEAKDRKAKILYTVDPGIRYVINEIHYPSDSTLLSETIQQTATGSLINKGDYFNLESLNKERERIDDTLKEKGYFFFLHEFLLYKVDSMHLGNADLYLTYKEGIPDVAKKIWKIGDISIYGNYSFARDSAINQKKGKKDKRFIIIDSKERYKTDLYDRTVRLKTGQTYRKRNHTITIERLMNLETFRFVRVLFNPDSTVKEPILNTRIYLTPQKKHSTRLEISGTSKSNNYLGSELSVRYRNNNLLKGAEILEAKVTGAYDFQVGGAQVNDNAFSFIGELNLFIPKILPYRKIRTYGNSYVPRTVFSAKAEYTKRPDQYTMKSLGLSFGYYLKTGKSTEHTLQLLNFSSIDPKNITPYFDSILQDDPALQASFQRQVLIGIKYRYLFNNTYRDKKKFNYYFEGQVSSSGNLYNLFFRPQPDTPGAVKFLGLPVSQFVRLQGDLRGYWKMNSNMVLVNRILAGSVFAYGNSSTAPYSEQFFIGGSNSIRAFRVRTLGPGSYHSPKDVYEANQSGELKLEMNSEIRYEKFKYLKLAAFADAGNIWYREDAAGEPGSGFDRGDLFAEMAVGAGVGIRLDFSVMVLRLDWAIPLRKPWYPKGERWVFNEISPGDKDWRKENLVLNIGIGYPF